MDNPPNDAKAESVAAIARGLLAAIPLAGGLIAEVANLYLNPLEKRKQRWLLMVSDAIKQIQDELKILPEALQQNEQFVSFLYQATQIALRNHQKSKLNALRGALVSAAQPEAVTEDVTFSFLRYIDELSASHVRVLACLSKHTGQFSRYTALEAVLARLQEFLREKFDRALFRAIIRDLEARSLILTTDVDDLPEYQSAQSALLEEGSKPQPIRVTAMGQNFLKFIHDAPP